MQHFPPPPLQLMDEGVYTNQAESFFSRLRRKEVGTRTHHHITRPHLYAYAKEASWREYNRRVANGDQAAMAARAAPRSRSWAGYWQH